jgi:hypothetical protein
MLLAALVSLAALSAPAPPPAQEPQTHENFSSAIGTIENALELREFEKVERLHDEFVASRARTTDGTWMIESFEWAFDAKFESDSPARLDALFEEWRVHSPRSSLRKLAEAFMWQNRAWRAHGAGCSSSWVAGAEKVFSLNLLRAARALEEAADAKASPLWYTVAIRIAGGQERGEKEIETILEEGEIRHPAYRPLYWARLMFLLPAWGGDYEQADRFVRRAVERTRATEGGSFYAGLYLDMTRATRCGDALADSEASWPDMKQGLLDMIERHESAWNWNLLGTLACRFRDADTVAWALGKLGKDAHLGTGSPGISTQSCRAMIRPAPAPSRAT